MKIILALCMILGMSIYAYGDDFSKALQDVSVTIKSEGHEGSGTIFTREMKNKDGAVEKVNFVWTAGHVISDLRTVREIIDSTGNTRKISEFKDASIVKEIAKDGRRVGELKMDVKVVKYSDAENGEDLALLRIIESDFIKANTTFYLDKNIPDIGIQLYHCGSLQGQMGANSMTTGIMSQIGRIYEGRVYDQTTVTAFPGSSGGGVFVKNAKGLPEYVGMVTRGSGETFNLIVPIRRMMIFAKTNNIEWSLDDKAKMPTMEELEKIPAEGMLKPDATKNLAAKGDIMPTPTPPVKPKTLELKIEPKPSNTNHYDVPHHMVIETSSKA